MRFPVLARPLAIVLLSVLLVALGVIGFRPTSPGVAGGAANELANTGSSEVAGEVAGENASADVRDRVEVVADGKAADDSKVSPLVVAPEQPDSQLQRELASYVATLDGTYGIAAYDFRTGRTVRINDDRPFPSASLYKLIVLDQAYKEIAAGRLSLSESVPITKANLQEDESSDLALGDRPTVAEAINLMVTISSNTAAHALLDRFGREEFNATAAQLGLNETQTPTGDAPSRGSGWRGYMASTSPRDMLRFFQLLGSRELVDSAASDAMMAVLLDQRVNDRIAAGLPAGIRVAHKTGELDGVRNDAGIVLTGNDAYVIAVLTQNVDEDEATAAIAEIARRVNAAFGGPTG